MPETIHLILFDCFSEGDRNLADSFKTGDIVQLKSGGPKMTVTDPSSYNGHVDTTWFAGANKKSGRFPAEAIEAVASGNL